MVYIQLVYPESSLRIKPTPNITLFYLNISYIKDLFKIIIKTNNLPDKLKSCPNIQEL